MVKNQTILSNKAISLFAQFDSKALAISTVPKKKSWPMFISVTAGLDYQVSVRFLNG